MDTVIYIEESVTFTLHLTPYSDKWPVFNTYGPKHMRPQISTISAQITIDNISTVNAVIAQNVNEQTMNEASHK